MPVSLVKRYSQTVYWSPGNRCYFIDWGGRPVPASVNLCRKGMERFTGGAPLFASPNFARVRDHRDFAPR